LKSHAAKKLGDNYIKEMIVKFEVRNFPTLPFKSLNISDGQNHKFTCCISGVRGGAVG
jgi:hypothetical protein